MARLPNNVERVRDGRNYRYRGYAADGYCCRIAKRGDGLWHAVAVINGRYIGKAASLVGIGDVLATTPAFTVEEVRKAAYRADPILADFVATALQDAQLREADDACEEEREERDTGTIYTLQAKTFEQLAAIVAKFRADCGEHIAAALELEPGEAGLQYTTHRYTDNSRIGSTLWLAVTGTGVNFTDDGDAPCLVAMAEWSRVQYCEGLYFGDDGQVYAMVSS